jgi:DNA-binding XRE family transcriptional regulator
MAIDQELLLKRIGARLKKRRVDCQMTQNELSSHIPLSRTSIANIEAGNQSPPLYILYEFCRVLAVEIDDILPPLKEILQSPSAMADDLARRIENSGANLTADALQEIMAGTSPTVGELDVQS